MEIKAKITFRILFFPNTWFLALCGKVNLFPKPHRPVFECYIETSYSHLKWKLSKLPVLARGYPNYNPNRPECTKFSGRRIVISFLPKFKSKTPWWFTELTVSVSIKEIVSARSTNSETLPPRRLLETSYFFK